MREIGGQLFRLIDPKERFLEVRTVGDGCLQSKCGLQESNNLEVINCHQSVLHAQAVWHFTEETEDLVKLAKVCFLLVLSKSSNQHGQVNAFIKGQDMWHLKD